MAPRVCVCVRVYVYTRVLVPPNMYIHTHSRGFSLTWYRALTWYFLRVMSSLRTHLEPWTAVDTPGRGSHHTHTAR